MAALTTKDFDNLEEEIDKSKVPIEKLVLTYRDLLFKLIDEGRFKNVSSVYLRLIKKFLDLELIRQAHQDENLRSELKMDLQTLVHNSKGNSDQYNLTRCLQFLFVSENDWETVAQDLPIFCFFVYLQKILADIEGEFIDHFQKSIPFV